MYRAYAGRPWSPAKGSRASHVTTASQISALDFLRARSERRRDRYDPQGPVVVVSGPQDWHDWRIIWNRLDQDRKSVVLGKSVSVRVDLGGRRSITKKKKTNIKSHINISTKKKKIHKTYTHQSNRN